MHLVVSAFTGGIGYINCELLPPFLRIDEICQPPHEPVADAAHVRRSGYGFAHLRLLKGPQRAPLPTRAAGAAPSR